MVNYEVVTGRKRALLISTYPPPSTLEHLTDLEEALTQLQEQGPIVLGDLNANICQYQNHWSNQVADLLMEFGMVDLLR